MPDDMHTIRLIAVVLLAGMVWGCTHEPPPLLAPAVQPEVSHFVGTPLSGPQAGNVQAEMLADSWVVKVNFLGLEQLPAIAATEPLDKDQRIKLILATRQGHPIVATGRLTQTVRIVPNAMGFLNDLRAGKLGRTVPICAQQGALTHGTTIRLGITDPSSALRPMAEEAWVKTIQLQFGREQAASDYQAAVVVADLQGETEEPAKEEDQPMPGNNYNAKPPTPTEPPVYQKEFAVYTPPPAAQVFALVVPMHFSSSTIKGVLAVVQILTEPTAAARQQANKDALKDLRLSTEATTRNVVVLDPPEWPGLSAAMAELGEPQRQRQALSYMATSAGARVTADAVLAADPSGLAIIADRVGKDLAVATAIKPAPGRKYLGWVIERACLYSLAWMQSAAKLSPELSAAMAINCGQAGRDASTFADVIGASISQQDFENHLAAANFEYLEDASRTARVRAYDWLSWRGLAPPASCGYDPRGKLSECRAALRRFQESTTQPVNP